MLKLLSEKAVLQQCTDFSFGGKARNEFPVSYHRKLSTFPTMCSQYRFSENKKHVSINLGYGPRWINSCFILHTCKDF